MPKLRNGNNGDSNPGSLDCESGILPTELPTVGLQPIGTWVYCMDATMTVTGDHKKMYVDDANVQTNDKENAISRINGNEHDRHVALESRIDPMDPVTHAAGCLVNILSNGQIAQPNVNVE